MTIKELLQRVSKTIIKQAPKVSEAPQANAKFVEYINKSFSKENIGKVAGKVAGAAMTANVTDALIKDVPVANNIYTWYATAVDKFYENTVRKIPVVGDFLRTITDTINKLVIPNAQKAIESSRINDPKFYTHLGLHTKFGIPLTYPDVVGIPFAGNKNYGSIGFIQLGFNPMTSYSKIKSRYTQLLELLKGVRGLSGQMPYSEADLFFYDWNTKYLVLQYFKLKYALKLARIYSLTKATLPSYLLEKIGFNSYDFIQNKALYIDLLGSMHEFIRQTVPNFGVIETRIRDLLYKLIPDSNDPKVALYYCVMLSMVVLLPNSSAGNYRVYKDFFVPGTAVSAGATSFNNDGTTSNMTYSVFYSNWQGYSSIFPSEYKPFGSIRGDLYGCFGEAIFWKDDKITEVETCKDDDMYHKFDELFLTQLQNGTILNMLGIDALPGGTTETTSVESTTIHNTTIPSFTSDGKVDDLLKPMGSRDYALLNVLHVGFNPQGSAGVIYMPQTDGLEYASSLTSTATNETSVVTNKENLSEGESYEVLQLMSWFEYSYGSYDSTSNKDKIEMLYRTQTFYITNFDVLYFDVVNNTNATIKVRPSSVYVTSGVTAFNAVSQMASVCQFWSQADYGIKLPIAINASGYRADALLLDFNIMGSISRKAYDVAVTNSAYSLYFADIKVDPKKTGKRIGNLVDAYRNAQ